MSAIFDEWFSRKFARHSTTIRFARTIDEGSPVRVVLGAEPTGAFEYRSAVRWGNDAERYEAAIVDGILDELIAVFGHLVADIRFTLREAAGTDPLGPNAHAFYRVARTATRKILEGNLLHTGPEES